jgi:hypothetical protein
VLISDRRNLVNFQGTAMKGRERSGRRLSSRVLGLNGAARTNGYLAMAGQFRPGNAVTVTVGMDSQSPLNPFFHKYHPDHDNLDVNFAALQPRGVEAYDITRTLRLTFTTPGTDFGSLTATAQSRTGVYEETMTIGAQGGAARDFRLSGSFSLQLISPVANLTTQ